VIPRDAVENIKNLILGNLEKKQTCLLFLIMQMSDNTFF